MATAGVGAIIAEVRPESIGAGLAIAPGDRIISINGNSVSDLIDYRFLIADECLEIEVEKPDGEIWVLEIEKDIDEDIGLTFASPVFDQVKSCRNSCIFCFVDQMPPNMRKSLYVKDDDYRLSFLQGSFITLTNLSEADIRRIITLKLSPLYISVHTVDEELRNIALASPKGAAGIKILDRLLAAGIQFHTQVVLVPGLNDGAFLEQSIGELAKRHPGILSLAVVPVGLTKFRTGLKSLRVFTPEEAKNVLELIEEQQQQFLRKLKTRFVFASDEFYFLAQRQIPGDEHYEDYCQLENGVGLSRLFWQQAEEWLAKNKGKLKQYPSAKQFIIVTGKSGAKVLQPVLRQITGLANFEIELAAIENDWFGPQVTVTGLLTASDILKALKQRSLAGKVVVIPDILLRKDGAVFLDDLSITDFKSLVEVPLLVAGTSGDGLLNALFEEAGIHGKADCGSCRQTERW
jgi:putative radical SAM enzyme (TIGR03279 family)